MKYKLAFIIPYFGTFPSTFQIWLNSCGWNQSFDWIIFTDDHTPHDYPPNVIIHYITFSEIKSLLQSNFDFAIDLPSAYKFCDFRPAYGDIFREYLTGYDFWGYCDIDLVWGNLEKWINDYTLDNIDRVSEWGHCCLFRNKEYINTLYQKHIEGMLDYKTVLASDCNFLYDEEGGGQKIFKHFAVPTLTIPLYDVKSDSKRFMPTYASKPFLKETYKDAVFKVSDGNVCLICNDAERVHRQEFAYVHMAKRTLKIEIDKNNLDYLIVPNKYINTEEVHLETLRKYQPKFNWYPQYQWKGFKGKIDVLLGRNKVKWPGSRLQKISDFLHDK
jgi:hypothetical protein